jgi:hypothetical protein
VSAWQCEEWVPAESPLQLSWHLIACDLDHIFACLSPRFVNSHDNSISVGLSLQNESELRIWYGEQTSRLRGHVSEEASGT